MLLVLHNGSYLQSPTMVSLNEVLPPSITSYGICHYSQNHRNIIYSCTICTIHLHRKLAR